MIFIGDKFVIGLLGKPAEFNIEGLEKTCKELSKKETKMMKKEEVKFTSKQKGSKPVVTKGIL